MLGRTSRSRTFGGPVLPSLQHGQEANTEGLVLSLQAHGYRVDTAWMVLFLHVMCCAQEETQWFGCTAAGLPPGSLQMNDYLLRSNFPVAQVHPHPHCIYLSHAHPLRITSMLSPF